MLRVTDVDYLGGYRLKKEDVSIDIAIKKRTFAKQIIGM